MAQRASVSRRHCVVPPHLLEALARNGSPGQLVTALNTLSIDHTLRSLRFARATSPKSPALVTPLAYADPRPRRAIYAARHAAQLPGELVRMEGGAATGDAAVDQAYAGLGATFELFHQVFRRNSIDGHGLPLQATVRYGKDYDNAFWDGVQLVFGDGDSEIFQRFTAAVEIIGHELTHGIIGFEANLQYVEQSGALNESIADVFGSLVKQYDQQQSAAQADWLIGSGLFTCQVNGRALRSMKEPGTGYDDSLLGKDPQPGHMRDYVRTFADNGGVHINSGIPNRAFYLVATAIGGSAWEAPGKIWYAALRDPTLRPNASFRSFARRTLQQAARLYGSESKEHEAVAGAWDEVGVRTR
jgi:Zn-dependent metalloprotease